MANGQCFRKLVRHQAPAGCSQRQPNRNIACLCGCPSNQEVGDVGACDEHHERNRDDQQVQTADRLPQRFDVLERHDPDTDRRCDLLASDVTIAACRQRVEFGPGAFERGACARRPNTLINGRSPGCPVSPSSVSGVQNDAFTGNPNPRHDANNHMRRPGQPDCLADQRAVRGKSARPQPMAQHHDWRRANPGVVGLQRPTNNAVVPSIGNVFAVMRTPRSRSGSTPLPARFSSTDSNAPTRQGSRRRPDAVVERACVGVRSPRCHLLERHELVRVRKGNGRVAPCTMLNIVVVNPMPIARATTATRATNRLLRGISLHSFDGICGEYVDRQAPVPGL